MAQVIADRVQESTSTTGTGTLSLAGATSAMQGFVSAIGSGNTTYYLIVSGNSTDWEVGQGTVTSGTPNTLSRTTVLASSNSGSKISLTGTSIASCVNPANHGIGSIDLDNALGSTQGQILYRGASAWTVLAPGTSGYFLQTQGAAANPAWAAAAGGGGGGSGLYNQVLSATPTQTSTGLSTWINQSTATTSNSSTGLTIASPNAGAGSLNCLSKTAASTPVSYSVLLSLTCLPTNFVSGGIGWTDGTKIETLAIGYNNGWQLWSQKWNSATSFNANYTTTASFGNGTLLWLKARNDGTNLTTAFSMDGVNYFQLETHTVTTFLANANTFLFFGNGQGAAPFTTLLSLTQGT